MIPSGDKALRKDLSPADFKLFRDWIHMQSGIFLEENRLDALRISLVARATRLGFTEYTDYFKFLTTHEDEFKELMNLVTINETSFFRFPAQFDALRDHVIPEILETKTSQIGSRFRIWSAGCSTGEEPYTLAMTVLDSALPASGVPVDIIGTDVSTQALDKARGAVYPARAVAGLSQGTIQRWFEPVKEGHRPIKPVRDLCEFHYQNLVKELHPITYTANWDIIFCRNVTIYFKLESTRAIVDRFFESLNPGGYLFVGHSETLTSVSDRFEVLEVGGVFLYRKPVPRRASVSAPAPAPRRPTTAARAAAAREAAATAPATPRPARRDRPVAPQAPAPAAQTPGPGDAGAARALVDEAHTLLEQARASEALAKAREALALDAGNVDAHLAAAFAHADLGQLDDAVAQAQVVVDADPLEPGARYIMGIIDQQRGDLDSALAQFKRTLYIDRDFVLAHFAIANIHRSRGAKPDAARAYENCLRSLYVNPQGSWTAFLGGFRPDLLARTCQRSFEECGGTTSG